MRLPFLTLTLCVCVLPLSGQCLVGDDGFAVGCCQVPAPNLPVFPAFTQDGKMGCLRDCALEAEHQVDVQLGAPGFVLPDQATIPINVVPTAPGSPAFGGVLIAKYTRTWLEPAGSPVQKQVWRFLLNGELQFTSAGTAIPCPTPPCSVSTRPHFVGHLDYTCRSVPGAPEEWRIGLSLNHLPGPIAHATWSAAPLTGADAHASRSYHLVAPASFTFAPVPEIQGNLVAESVRDADLSLAPFSYVLHGEAAVQQAQLTSVGSTCVGAGAAAGTPWVWQTLTGSAACAGTTGSFQSIPVPGTPFSQGLLALRLGRFEVGGPWTPENLTIYVGVVQYGSICTSASPFRVMTGVGTDRIVPADLFPGPGGLVPPPVRGFVDLQDQQLLGPTGLFGGYAVATRVFNLNRP